MSGREPGDDDDLEEDLVPLGQVLQALDDERHPAAAETARDLLRRSRTPPHAMDAERAVLGAVLLSPECVDDVVDTGLSAADFYREHHGTIYEAVLSLKAKSEPVDTVTVVDALLARGQLEAVGGAAAISQLEALLPTAAHAKAYAKLVREKATLRRTIEAATEIVTRAYAQDRPAEEVVEDAAAKFMELTSTKLGSVVDRAQVVRDVMRDIGKPQSRGFSTGFADLDNGLLARGMRPGQMIVVGARPAMGKTVFGHQVAQHVADTQAHAAYFSFEMDGYELIEREISSRSRIPSLAWNANMHTGKLQSAAGHVSERALHIVYCPGAGLPRVAAELRRLVSRRGVGFAVIDHLGLIAGSAAFRGNRVQQVGEVSRGLKALAGELQIPVMVLSQLNRTVEGRADKRPGLSDLRDTGDIEQDADIVGFLHRPEYYLKEKTPEELKGVCEVLIEKHRNGPTGMACLFFRPETTRFVDAVSEGSR